MKRILLIVIISYKCSGIFNGFALPAVIQFIEVRDFWMNKQNTLFWF